MLVPCLVLSTKAEEDNPDPSKLAPVALIGWENLKERLVGQQKEMQKMAEFVAVGAPTRFTDKARLNLTRRWALCKIVV